MTDVLDQWQYFVSPIYSIKKPEFLDNAIAASRGVLADQAVDPIYPMAQADLSNAPVLKPFFDYAVNTAWNILSEQGYQMDGMSTYLSDVWAQKHHKFSSMDYHVHNECDLVGFYFTECPDNAPKMVIHDPRTMHTASPLAEADVSKITLATRMVNFVPEPGTLMFAPAWLAHSFTRNPSSKPFTFIHLSIHAKPYIAPIECPATAEII